MPADPHQLNVSITRDRDTLVVIGDAASRGNQSATDSFELPRGSLSEISSLEDAAEKGTEPAAHPSLDKLTETKTEPASDSSLQKAEKTKTEPAVNPSPEDPLLQKADKTKTEPAVNPSLGSRYDSSGSNETTGTEAGGDSVDSTEGSAHVDGKW